MKKTFALNTSPHEADIGETQLLFQPEVMGDDFMDAYQALREAQRSSGVDVDDLSSAEPAALRNVTRSLRLFLAELMLEESAELFTRLDVVHGGEVLASFTDFDEAYEYAAKVPDGARVVDRLRLPDRVLIQVMDWVVELYGGGQRPPTSSGGSAKASPPAGKRGMGVSPSKGPTRTRGR